MAQQNIDFGSFPDDPSADAIRTAFSKVQNNFNQLFSTNANSTVNSINRTPGAGITVNYPTGNVVISANIACLLVATTSLKVGRGADNTQSNVTITSSSQQLNIDIDPENVYSNNFAAPSGSLANLNGTLTSNSFYQPNINTLGTLSSLSVSGNANISGNASFTSNANFTGANINFSNISNLHIQGGSLGYYLRTDGSGNLEWAAGGGGGGGGSPGGVNTSVQFNDAGSFGANLGFTFNKVTGILTVPSLTVSNVAILGNLLGTLANGNSNVNIPSANGNVNIGVAGNANVFVVTGVGANITGNLNVDDKIVANRLEVNLVTGTLTTNAQPNVTSVGTLTILSVTGNLSSGNANLGNLAEANFFAGTLITNAQPNITSTGTLTSLAVTGNANVGNLNVANNVIVTGNLSVLGNATYINIESLEIEDPIISLGGGPNGTPLVANDGKDRGTALQYYTTAPVTAFMGWDNSNSEFAFGSNVIISSGEVVTFTNLGNIRASYFIGANTEFGNANLGNTAIANYFVGRFYGNANAATTAGTVTTNAQPNITSVGTLTSLAVTGNTTSGNFVGTLANGNSNIRIAADSNIGLSSTGVANVVIVTGTGANVTGTLGVSGNLTAANILGPLSNGNSNVNIPSANGNINLTSVGNTTLVVTGTGANVTGTLSASGNISASGVFIGNGAGLTNINAGNITGAYGNSQVATFLNTYGSNTITTTGNVSVGNIIGNGQALTGLAGGNVIGQVGNALVAGTVYTAAQGNITSVGTLTSLSVSGNANIGNIGTATAIVTTGNITTINSGLLQNGNSNIRITANSSITLSAMGSPSVVTVNDLGATVSGTLSASGNANVGNLGTAQVLASANITAPQLISNVATGTAPFVVTSTTQVANLSVATAGSATTAGTVTTAAQGNITSLGTLTGLGVNGTVTAVAFTANTGVFTGNGSGLTALNASSISSGTLAQARLANANLTLGSTALTLGSTVTTVAGLSSVTSTSFVGALSGAATTAGTVTTNAQPNITSVGNLTSLTVQPATAIISAVPVTITQTWNNANATFTAFNIAINSNANSNTSRFVDFQDDGSTVIFIGLDGVVDTIGNVKTTKQFVSTIATGTAPLVVNSTTQVANLNAATAGLATFATTANAVAGANVSGTVANATYATSAGSATTAGTVTTNAQPNITSTGTLVSLSVSGNANIGNIGTGGLITATGNISGANVIVTGYHIRSVGTGITAAGSTQGTGTALSKEINIVSSVSSGQGVVLPTAVAGMVVTVTNTTGTTLTVYPASGGTINALASNAGFTMGTTTIQFIAPTTTQWYTTGATYA